MKLKKIVALVVSAVMVTSLAACGNDSGKEKGGDAVMTIELDSAFSEELAEEIRKMAHIQDVILFHLN